MKRIEIILIVVLMFSGMILSGASITVNKPNTPGLSWAIGTSKTIEWTTSGIPASARLRISLLKGTTNLGVIADNVEIDASPLSWTVGNHSNGTAPIGENYFIKIKQKGALVTGKNVHSFKIRLKFMELKPGIVVKPSLKKMVMLTLLPDLTGNVTYEIAPHHTEGYNVSHFHITVTNSGLGATTNTTNVGAKLINYGPDGAHRLSGHDAWWPGTVPILAPGESYTYHGTYNFRAPNYYMVEAWVDSERKVKETGTGETNNTFNTVKFKVP